MAGCPRFIGWTYLHLLVGALVSALGAQYDIVENANSLVGIKTDGVVAELTLFIGIFVFVYLTIISPPGVMKYVLFFCTVILTGTTFRSLADRIGEKQTLNDVLGTISGILMCMAAVGLYDYNNNFSIWVYLGASLLGLILGRLGMGVALIIGDSSTVKEPLTGLNYLLSVGATFVFSLYIVHETSVLKGVAVACDDRKGSPDYIGNIMKLYTDILGVFMEVKVPR